MNAILFAIVLAVAGPPASAATATVHIKNFAFDPATLTVAADTTVRFVNDDSFNSDGLDTNDSWSFRFTKPGTYAYFCQLHPYMKGTVIVK
jgi:plastocyanin